LSLQQRAVIGGAMAPSEPIDYDVGRNKNDIDCGCVRMARWRPGEVVEHLREATASMFGRKE